MAPTTGSYTRYGTPRHGNVWRLCIFVCFWVRLSLVSRNRKIHDVGVTHLLGNVKPSGYYSYFHLLCKKLVYFHTKFALYSVKQAQLSFEVELADAAPL